MSDKAFVDTNVLIYAHDSDAKSKHLIAKSILQELGANTVVLSALRCCSNSMSTSREKSRIQCRESQLAWW